MSQVRRGSRLTKKKTGNALLLAKQRIQDMNLIKGLTISYCILVLLPIVWTPVTADDIPNSKSRVVISNMPGDFFSSYISVFLSNTQQWIDAEGRFFPGATFYGLGIHTIFQGIGLYKVYLFGISLTLFLLLFQVMSGCFPLTSQLLEHCSPCLDIASAIDIFMMALVHLLAKFHLRGLYFSYRFFY